MRTLCSSIQILTEKKNKMSTSQTLTAFKASGLLNIDLIKTDFVLFDSSQ